MKKDRQEKVLSLIKEKVIVTQEELQKELIALGFKVTQSTVSRDIKDLQLFKGHDNEGHYRYIPVPSMGERNRTLLKDTFSRSVDSLDYAMNNVVIKCHTGMASGACVALDELFREHMIGSLAGEDTIIVVTRNEEESANLVAELEKLL